MKNVLQKIVCEKCSKLFENLERVYSSKHGAYFWVCQACKKDLKAYRKPRYSRKDYQAFAKIFNETNPEIRDQSQSAKDFITSVKHQNAILVKVVSLFQDDNPENFDTMRFIKATCRFKLDNFPKEGERK